MKTLVTGANGFVGSAVVRQLLEMGHEVCCLVRPGSDRRNLDNLEVDIRPGELRDQDSLISAVRGCNNLFHVAADYRLWVPNPDYMYEVNVNGTEKLLLAAHNAGIEKIVYTSSVATLGINTDRTPANEKTPSSLASMTGHYKRSKFLAEKKVNQLTESLNLPLVIVNPSTPIGPRDYKPTPTGRIVVDTLNNKMPAYVNTGLNIVHVDDVARGHLLAFEKGKTGECYILGGENMSLLEILTTIDSIVGLKRNRFRLPWQAVLPLAGIMEIIANITGNEPRATIDSVRMSGKYMYFSSEKSIRDLDYTFRPARAALQDAIIWFIENNYGDKTINLET